MNKIWLIGFAAAMMITMTGCSTTKGQQPDTTIAESKGGLPEIQQSIKSDKSQALEAKQGSAEPIRVAALRGPTAMGMVKMMGDDRDSETALYDFQVITAIDEITASLVKGELDLAAVPANLASVLYHNSNGQIQVLAINTLGVLNIVENGDTIHSLEDLKGKTVYATGKGATPELALNYILTSNGLKPGEDLTIEFKSEPAECVAMLSKEAHAIAMLPQPFVTSAMLNDDNIKIALDLTEEWNKVGSDSSLLTGVVVVRKEFLTNSSDRVNQFLDEYQQSINFVNENLQEAAALIAGYEIVPYPVAEKAIPNCNITFIEGKEMKQLLQGYLQILLDQNQQSVGGKLPDEGFYYIR